MAVADCLAEVAQSLDLDFAKVVQSLAGDKFAQKTA